MQTHSLGNILREVPIDLSKGDFTGDGEFFLRSTAGAAISYLPMNNSEADGETITKTLPASEKFDDPVLCKKVFAVIADGEQSLPSDLYAGYGV